MYLSRVKFILSAHDYQVLNSIKSDTLQLTFRKKGHSKTYINKIVRRLVATSTYSITIELKRNVDIPDECIHNFLSSTVGPRKIRSPDQSILSLCWKDMTPVLPQSFS